MYMDFSKHCGLVWLWNAAAMFSISFFTNYWQYNEYDYKLLIENLSIEKISATFYSNNNKNGTTFENQFYLTIDGWDTFKWHHLLTIDLFFINEQVINKRICRKLNDESKISKMMVEFEWTKNRCLEHYYRFLYTEYTNLFKECNDLFDNSRELLHGKQLLDLESCHHFILNQHQWHDFHRLHLIGVLEHFAFGLGCASFVAMTTSLVLGTYGALSRKMRLEHIAGLSLSIFGKF
uniref:Uncharacterized protein n=1 Tax=Romanomermis culicivorax TaxID=13658 RepID=A0A915J7T3_ROMCU